MLLIFYILFLVSSKTLFLRGIIIENNPIKIRKIINNLKGVLKTSSNETQRIRVYKEIQKLEKELLSLDLEESSDDSHLDYDNTSNSISEYKYLKDIEVLKVPSSVDNSEANEIYTFLKYFEEEFLVLLSPYYIKLGLNYSITRETFYTDIYNCYSALYLYVETLEKIANDSLLENYKIKLKLDSQSEYRNLFSKLSTFLHKLYKFTYDLIENYDTGGRLILNADDILKLEVPLKGKMLLRDYTVIDGFRYLYDFLTELIDYLRLPRIAINNIYIK